MSQENVRLMRRWFQEVWNERKTETVFELFAPNGVARGQGGSETELRGPEQFMLFVSTIRGAFPDIHVTIEDVFAVDDKVVVRWSATMTHTGEGVGVPPTGKKVRSTGISIARVLDGKIVEGWDSWDQLGMLQQIGAYTPPRAILLEKTA